MGVNRVDSHKKAEIIDYRLLFENGYWKIIRTTELEIKSDNDKSNLMKVKYLKLLLEINPFDERFLKVAKYFEISEYWKDIDKFKGKKISTAGLEIEINNVITSKNGDEQFFELKNAASDSEDIIGLEMSFYNSNTGRIGVTWMNISLVDNENNIYSNRSYSSSNNNFRDRILDLYLNADSRVDGLKVYFKVKKKKKICLLKVTGDTNLRKENSQLLAFIKGKEYYDGLLNICND